MAAGRRDGLGRIDDARTLHPAALDCLAQRQGHAAVIAEVADGGEAGPQRLHAVHLRFEGVEGRVVADVGEQLLLAAAVTRKMDVAVDQAGEYGLAAEIDDDGPRLDSREAITDGNNPAIVDDDRRRTPRRLAGDGDEPARLDVDGRRHGSRGGAERKAGGK